MVLNLIFYSDVFTDGKTQIDISLDNSSEIGDNKRYNKNHDGKTGRFTFGKGVSGGGSYSGKSNYAKIPRARMSAYEKEIVSRAIATDFPKLKPSDEIRTYHYANHCYRFTVNEFSSYNYLKKSKIK